MLRTAKAATLNFVAGHKDDFILVLLLIIIFFYFGLFRNLELPGLFYDGAGPDCVTATTLNPKLRNPIPVLPQLADIRLMGYTHVGMLSYYVSLPAMALFGFSISTIYIGYATWGIGIIIVLYALIYDITQKRSVAFFGGLLLISDIAFAMGLRGHAHLVLGTSVLFFASLLCLRKGGRWGCFFSGLSIGLATYNYFIFAFFGPALLLMLLLHPRRRIIPWFIGGLIGFLPLILGYISFILTYDSIENALTTLKTLVGNVAPSSSTASLHTAIFHSLYSGWLALSNIATEGEFFNNYAFSNNIPYWAAIKTTLFATICAVAILFHTQRKCILLYASLPISFMLTAALTFGTRIWGHHYSTFVPLAYFLFIISLDKICSNFKLRKLFYVCIVLFLAANTGQSNAFHSRLASIGGTGVSSNAITRFAYEAVADDSKTLYVFPEWGMYQQFIFLSGNKAHATVTYSHIDKNWRKYYERICIAFFSANNSQKYADFFREINAKSVVTKNWNQLDKKTAFYTMTGS